MATVSPYVIRHIQLDQKRDLYSELNDKGRSYFLFWWKQIPLGHLYLEQDEKPDRDLIYKKVLKAIRPGIKFYIAENKLFINNYQISSLQQDYEEFAMIMNLIFSAYQVTIFPKRPDVSIIICTRNRRKSLKRCLDSLFNQIYLPQEIIVVDNAPSDESTCEMVEQFKEVIYVREPRPGLSVARNTGLRLSTSPVVAFADDDVIMHPLWTYCIWRTFQAPEVSSMTGLVLASSLETESQQIFEKYWGFNKGYRDKTFDRSFLDKYLKKGPPVWVIGAGANMAFRRSLFDTIGYFDERLGAGTSGCSEDSEIWFRMLLNGFNIHYNPRAIVYHEHRKELSAFRKQMYSYTRGHIVAALIQHQQHKKAGYTRRVFFEYPVFFLRRLIKSFPAYDQKNRSLFFEICGWCSGILFFLRKCSKPMTKLHIKKRELPLVKSPNTV